ncbi:hypothetical protein [Kitasatospora sp. NPDC057223]|uniref:hypothetical protein n=1 Tax=Kitasatospora sp. NPDC057223 TaxID=3346055 RepID=UPI0036416D29
MTATPRTYTLTGPDNRPYPSPVPGTLGGHRPGRLYGRLDCPSARRAIAAGGYTRHRVFFPDEPTAVAAGYRPCAVCLPGPYRRWKHTAGGHPMHPRSPLLRPAGTPAPGDPPAPAPHTEAELAALLALLTAQPAGIRTVAVGHSRDEASRAAATAFTEAWQTVEGACILAVVDWPEQAASWLRPARRLTAETPDAWVIAAAGPGWAQLARRLRHSTDWDPARTFAFASLADPRIATLTGPGILDGLRGATAGGGVWDVNG